MTTNNEGVSDTDLSNSGITAWDIDELYDKVADLIIDFEDEQIRTTSKFEEVTHAINCCRQNQKKDAQQAIYKSRMISVAVGLYIGTMVALFLTKKR